MKLFLSTDTIRVFDPSTVVGPAMAAPLEDLGLLTASLGTVHTLLLNVYAERKRQHDEHQAKVKAGLQRREQEQRRRSQRARKAATARHSKKATAPAASSPDAEAPAPVPGVRRVARAAKAKG